MSYSYVAVGNGARTDHPIPELPFVEDSCLPLEDPAGIEAIGRVERSGTWGRTDECRNGGWVAYTTDPARGDLAWVVRWHPEHGRSVVLYRNEDASGAYMAYWQSRPLLFRFGGYWWDGSGWFRPSQVYDLARETYVERPVPAALTVSAADMLEGLDAAAAGVILTVEQVDLDHSPYGPGGRRWPDDLARWAAGHDGGRHLAACVVGLATPELDAGQLLGVPEMAEAGGIAASTLRAYLTRAENEVPLPQAIVGGRAMWSRPVAQDWAEQRRRSRDGVVATMADREHTNLSVGVTKLWESFTDWFQTDLWDRTEYRKRFALRWRTQQATRDLARNLAWTVADSLNRIVPLEDLSITLHYAILWEFADFQRLHHDGVGDAEPPTNYPLLPQVAHMLDWLIQHDPGKARRTVAEIAGDAERQLQIPVAVTGRSLRGALVLDGKLTDKSTYKEFLALALPPAS